MAEVRTKELWMSYEVVEALAEMDGSSYFYNKYLLKVNSNMSACFFSASKNFGSQEGRILEMDKEGNLSVNKNQIKLGKVVKALAGDDLADEEIEAIVSAWKSKYDIDTSGVKVSDDIHKIYDISSVGGSCMAMMNSEYFEIYKDAGCRIAYLKNEDTGRLDARALIHYLVDKDGEEYEVLDRIFFRDEKSKLTLQKWRKEQEGMTRFQFLDDVGLRTISSVDETYDAVPYIDSIFLVRNIDGENYLANSSCGEGYYVDACQETTGSSGDGVISLGEDRVWVIDWEEYVNEDDAYYCDGDGEYYGDSSTLVYIEGHGYYRADDEGVAEDEETGQWEFRENLKYSEYDDIYTSSDDYVLVEAGDYDGSYEYIDNVTYADDISGYVMTEETQYIDDIEENWYNYESAHEWSDGTLNEAEEEIEEEEEEEA